jgi:hypothetical protein
LLQINPCTTSQNRVCIAVPNATCQRNSTSYLQCYCKAGLYGNVTGTNTSNCISCPIGMVCPGVRQMST